MSHTHQWYVAKYTLLSLPDREGYADRFTQWRCRTCPMFAEIDGNVRQGYPLMTPEFWDALTPESPVKTTRQARRWLRTHQR